MSRKDTHMSHTYSFFLILSLLAFGCQQDGSIGTDGVIAGLNRTDPGATLPTGGEIAVVWSVTSGSPDYSYVAGRGSLSATGFELTLPSEMPAEAVNSYGVGVGIIAAWPEGAPADGRVSDEAEDGLQVGVIGATERHAIIYVAPDASGELEWSSEFPAGFSCGVGVDSESGFDTFEPISCDLVELRIGNLADFDFVNWT
ncbi:MAG: hypothetical protein AB8H86_06700 [Polyangiales bacterium]